MEPGTFDGDFKANWAQHLQQRNSKYSFDDFTNGTLVDATDLDNSIIIGSCFYQICPLDHKGDPFVKVFPDDMHGVTFVQCNLDNVYVPPGNKIDPSCTHRRIKKMNDGEDWLLDDDLNPTAPVHKQMLLRLNKNVDPRKIPSQRLSVKDSRKKRLIELAERLASRKVIK